MNVDYDVFFPRDGRVIITRHDGGVPTEDEIAALAEKMGAEDYSRYDYLYDVQMSVNGVYEKNGVPLEKLLGYDIQSRFVRPKQRPYMTDNFYGAIQRQIDINREARFIAEKHPNPTPP